MDTLVVELPSSAEDWASFEGREFDAKVRVLDIAGRRIEAAIVGATDHSHRTGHFLTDGHRTVGNWLMATTNCSRGEANARRRSAKLIRELTTVAEEFMAGKVGVAQVRELARLAANPRAGDQLGESEDLLLEAAQTLEFADFRVVTSRWEQLADADGAHREHERAHDERNARCDFDGAVFRFETSHGVVQGTSMRDVFQAFCDAEFERDWQWVQATYGDEANRSLLPRTAGQRRADAFVAMVLAAAEAGVGDGRSIDTTVNLVCDLDQYEQRLESEITGEPVDVDPSTVKERRCETTDGVPVDPRQMVAAAVLGRLRLIVTDEAGVIVHAGRKRKLFNGALREAIMAIDPMCGWLGCTLRAQICDIDHLEPRSRGGPTNPRNGKILCHKHNVFKHVNDFRVSRRSDGTIEIHRPDGSQLRPPDAA
ncbi:MAG: DUF222 domain-containing protein [Ilumatobacter sp.]|uniref:HNH endonuclease n=1 Tax=Ilumatobacter sp. TaxID=1967498 RepID=UPI0026339B99|nr:HNH endonuclease signature motif containing protein [Ilumatobacter sp.]MDJ0769953.1 DUF222 domain-containing protein [Ilumatobacter sp.]